MGDKRIAELEGLLREFVKIEETKPVKTMYDYGTLTERMGGIGGAKTCSKHGAVITYCSVCKHESERHRESETFLFEAEQSKRRRDLMRRACAYLDQPTTCTHTWANGTCTTTCGHTYHATHDETHCGGCGKAIAGQGNDSIPDTCPPGWNPDQRAWGVKKEKA